MQLQPMIYSDTQPFNAQECQKSKIKKIPNFILKSIEKQMVPCKSTAKDVSFE